jgi:moderate conductance mechanosensitive channel
MKHLSAWWKALGKKERIGFIISAVWWALALAFVIVFSLHAYLFPEAELDDCFRLSRSLAGDWPDIWPRLVGTFYYFCLIIGVSKVFRFILDHLWTASRRGKTIIKLFSSFFKYAALIVTVLVIIAVWGVDSTSLLISAGIIALIIGLGAQSLISDIIAGLNIVFEDEFHVGDIVVIDDFRGSIVDIGLTTTKIVDPAGNTKIINNSQISTIVNLSDHPSVAACLMYIDYDEDLVKIEKLLNDNAEEIKKEVPGAIDTPKYIGVSALQDGYIELKIICHCKEENRFQTERDLNRAYCLLFLNNNVDYPYNQLVIGSRALTHPQDAADPEQLKKILARLAGDETASKK